MAADACSTFESALLLWTQQSLQHHLYSNATFLAERLHAHAPSEESAHVLATCHFSSGDKVRAYHLLQGCVAAHNRYLLALCCLELGHLNEAERVLLGPSPAGTAGGAHAGPADPLSVPNGAAGLHLLGTVCLKSQRREQAARYFAQALELNPYLWSAYEALCQLGIEPPPLTVAASADLVPPMRWPASERRAPRADGAGAFERAAGAAAPPPPPPRAAPPVSAHLGPATPGVGPSPVGSYGAGGLFGSGARAPAAFTPMSVGAAAAAGGLGALSPLPAIAASLAGTVAGESLWAQPSPTPAFGAAARGGADGGADGGGSGGGGFGGAPARSRRALGGAGVPGASGSWLFPSAAAADGAPLGANAAGSAARRLPATGGGGVGARAGGAPPSAVLSSAAPVRRSSRLSGGGAPPFELPSASAAGGAATAEGLMGDGADARARDAAAAADDDDDADELCGGGAEGACPAALLLRQLACALHRLCTYRCADALALLHRLPRSQARTGWVLCQIGRAHFESVNYPEAERAFSLALSVEPHRLAGHELHSTLLWHLRAEVPLCALAQRALALDRQSATTWAILGNCFSLQKEHKTALRFLKRAIQLGPDFAYAHTLCGHEHAAVEDFDKALAAYRRAIALDERHYNAWYGLGSIYFRQEKYDLAELHLARALEIHPRSSPLQCYFGMALHEKALAEGVRPERALLVLETAIELDAHNPLARFQKARVLLSLDHKQLALQELLELREFAPKEGAVHLMLGRVYKQLGQPQQALVAMSTALDLNPKDAQMIKAAIHKLDAADDDDVDDGP